MPWNGTHFGSDAATESRVSLLRKLGAMMRKVSSVNRRTEATFQRAKRSMLCFRL